MRIDVALAAAELLRAGVGSGAERGRRQQLPALAHRLCRLPDREVRGVRLRRAREVDGRLRQVEASLRQADVLDGMRRRDGDDECLRVGVADVLGREDDHAARDEPRVFASFEHRGEVVDGGLDVARPRRLDPRRDEVVVLVASLVVGERPLARRVVHVTFLERAALGPRGLDATVRGCSARCARRRRRGWRSALPPPARRRPRARRAPRRTTSCRVSIECGSSS